MFDTFGGVGNPIAHLRAYHDQLVGVGRDEALLIRLFSLSFSGRLWSSSPRMKPGNGAAGMHWPKILSIDSLTTYKLFQIDTLWKR